MHLVLAHEVIGRIVRVLADEREVTVLASEPPDDFTRGPADLHDLAHGSQGDQVIVIQRVDGDRIDVVQVHGGDIDVRERVGDRQVIQGTPLENDVLIGVDFLDDCAGKDGIGPAEREKLAHIHRAGFA